MKKNLTLIYLVVSCIANAQGVWTQKANFGGAGRTSAVGFSIGGKGYIGTGYSYNSVTGNQYYKDFWEWDQFTDVWTQKADFGGGSRNFAVGFSIGGKGYIGTGKTSGSFYYDFWEWDQSTNIWMQKADFGGGARAGAVGFSIGTKGYIGTGDGGGYKKDFWEWDQATNIWSQKVDFAGTARWSACGFAIGAKGYIGTGYDGVKKQDFWEWDQATNIWMQRTVFGGPIRTLAVGFSIGTKGYIGVGHKNNPGGPTALGDFWEWDQATDTWIQQTNYGSIGGGGVGFSIANQGYIGTGGDGYFPTYNNFFWEYTPSYSGSIVVDSYPSCFAQCNGALTINQQGGTPPYSYLWGNAETNQTITALCAGTYSVSVTDFTGATTAAIVILTEPTAITNSLAITSPGCGNNNGSVTASTGGGVSPYTYFWSNGNTTASVTGLSGQPSDTLIVTVIDSHGCTRNDTAVVSCVTGIANHDLRNQFIIYPTLNSGAFSIASKEEQYTLIVLNIVGEKVYSAQISSGKTEIDLSTQPKGIYFCKVILENGAVVVEKVIIE